MAKERCFEYLRECHPTIWDRLMLLDEAVRFKVYNLLVEYLQESGLGLSDDDVGLLGAFGIDDAALKRLMERVS